MTDEEKQKLYEAIGYQEVPTVTEYPKEVLKYIPYFPLFN